MGKENNNHKRGVVILTAPISSDKDEVFHYYHKIDSVLEGIALDYCHRLEAKNIEIFDREDNILIAENGYFFACYVNELDANKET